MSVSFLHVRLMWYSICSAATSSNAVMVICISFSAIFSCSVYAVSYASCTLVKAIGLNCSLAGDCCTSVSTLELVSSLCYIAKSSWMPSLCSCEFQCTILLSQGQLELPDYMIPPLPNIHFLLPHARNVHTHTHLWLACGGMHICSTTHCPS